LKTIGNIGITSFTAGTSSRKRHIQIKIRKFKKHNFPAILSNMSLRYLIKNTA